MSDERKPWMTPVVYNDDRFDATPPKVHTEELVDTPRPSGPDRSSPPTTSTDLDSMDYGRGPHDDGFDEDDDDDDSLHLGAFEEASVMDEEEDMEDWDDEEDDDDEE